MASKNQHSTNNRFIDENHEQLLDTLTALDNSLSGPYDNDCFLSDINHFICDLENHFLHEETLLRGAGFSNLEVHILKHREIAISLREGALTIANSGSATGFMMKARSRILNHELIYDQEYWPAMDELPPHDAVLIPWTKGLETGYEDMDKQHRGLTTYINRFHYIYFENASRERACSELRSLYAYSKLHFDEEETLFEKSINDTHKEQHKHLLEDLDLLISEIHNGQYKLENISSHLKYWFLNHLRHFDIPAFRKPH